MKKFKKTLRLIGMIIFMVMAAIGMGIAPIFGRNERYQDKPIVIEQMDKREEDEEEDMNEFKV